MGIPAGMGMDMGIDMGMDMPGIMPYMPYGIMPGMSMGGITCPGMSMWGCGMPAGMKPYGMPGVMPIVVSGMPGSEVAAMMAAATGGAALTLEPALDARMLLGAVAPLPALLGVTGNDTVPPEVTSRLQLEYHDSKSACIFSRFVPSTR